MRPRRFVPLVLLLAPASWAFTGAAAPLWRWRGSKLGVAPVQMTRQTHCRQRWQKRLRRAGVLFGLLGEPPLLLLREAQRVLLRNRDPLRLPDHQIRINSSRVDSDPLENSYVPLLRPVPVKKRGENREKTGKDRGKNGEKI